MSENATPNAAGIKDTLESIIIALILAFVFRCFFVEAFVIPTGSMAPTLLGANMRFKCPDCQGDVTGNYSAPQIPGTDNIAIPNRATSDIPLADKQGNRVLTPDGRRQVIASVPSPFVITCPNCGFKLPKAETTGPAVHYGDRILVLKYASLLEAPKRWDVIVFRSPFDQRSNTPRPQNQPDFQQNYIKRLIGLPGEQVLLLDGDVYARTSDSAPWTVQTKPRSAQEALWRIVSDLDHAPRGLSRTEPYRDPWITPSGQQPFTPQPGRRSYLSPATGDATLSFDPTANSRKAALTDWLAFNSPHPQQEQFPRETTYSVSDAGDFYYRWKEIPGNNPVSDILLRATLQRQSGDGPISLALTKRDHHFTARFLPGKVDLLLKLPDGAEQTLGSHPLPTSNQPLDVEFQNVDYRVTLRINGKDVLVTTPAQYAPDVTALHAEHKAHRLAPQPTISITTSNAAARISHLSLWRDVYYINNGNNYRDPAWGSPEDPITLAKGEYFPLGDNAALSLDARFWRNPVDLPAEDLFTQGGRVPERFMLGKAFFVYWPAGYRLTDSTPGVVPNFGQMRLIH